MKTKVALRIVARSAHYFVDLAVFTAGDPYPSPDGRAVRTNADALDHDPVILVPAIVTQQRRRPVQIVYDHIDVAVVVEISEGAAAAEVFCLYRWPGFCGNIFEAAVPQVAIQDLRLFVRNVQFSLGD